jgi:arylformamidase
MVIDLSVPINAAMPVYPGDPKVSIKKAAAFENDGYVGHYTSISTHVGTHIDAPMHMVDGGAPLSAFSIERFIGKGRLIDVESSGFSTDAVQQAGIEAGDIVLFRTGKVWLAPDYFASWPVMPKEVADYLVQQKVSLVGVDAAGVDGLDETKNHKTLLEGNVLIIENLTNLDKLVGKEFTVYALPIKLELDGAPARVVAQID